MGILRPRQYVREKYNKNAITIIYLHMCSSIFFASNDKEIHKIARKVFNKLTFLIKTYCKKVHQYPIEIHTFPIQNVFQFNSIIVDKKHKIFTNLESLGRLLPKNLSSFKKIIIEYLNLNKVKISYSRQTDSWSCGFYVCIVLDFF